MSSITIEQPTLRGPDSGFGGGWHVIVANDDHNTFDGVAGALSKTLPGVSLAQGFKFANEIHNSGRARVWSGHLEQAEHYWEQLCDQGLTMVPLEQG